VTAVIDPYGESTISIEYIGKQAVLGVRGELDIVAVPELANLFDAVIASGSDSIVVDLGDLDFIATAGLEEVANGARRLAALGGRLTIRSPSTMVRRLLDATGLTDLTLSEGSEARPDHLGPEQSVGPTGRPTRSGPHPLIRELRRFASFSSTGDVVDGALHLVVTLARATVGGADGVSVSLRRTGRLATVAATDRTILDMDAGQYATGQGPCVDASVEGRWFHIESLNDETRWPAFTPTAQALGINAVLSSPLLAWNRPVGAINFYSRSVSAFAPEGQRLASVIAAEASVIVTDAGVDMTDDLLASAPRSVPRQGRPRTRRGLP
jgi:anti-anti-sigma factor